MKHIDASQSQTRRRAFISASAVVLAVASALALSQTAHAHDYARDHIHEITPPDVPDDLRVPEGNFAFLKGEAIGTQNYVCTPSGAGFAWVLFTPVATLSNKADKQIITHFFSPNPDPNDVNTDPRVVANGAIRAAWQARDTSTIWAKVSPLAAPSFDPKFVRPGSVAWLLLEAVGVQEGPTGGDTLTPTTFVQRVNTSGGLAPSTGCAQSADVGKKAFVPYTADYFFFTNPDAIESSQDR
jgi:hypothetical protein